jgi:hypothetical protein
MIYQMFGKLLLDAIYAIRNSKIYLVLRVLQYYISHSITPTVASAEPRNTFHTPYHIPYTPIVEVLAIEIWLQIMTVSNSMVTTKVNAFNLVLNPCD